MAPPATADRAGRLAMVDHTVHPAMAVAVIPVRRAEDIHLVVEAAADTPLVEAVDTPAVAAGTPVAVITNTRGELMDEWM